MQCILAVRILIIEHLDYLTALHVPRLKVKSGNEHKAAYLKCIVSVMKSQQPHKMEENDQREG